MYKYDFPFFNAVDLKSHELALKVSAVQDGIGAIKIQPAVYKVATCCIQTTLLFPSQSVHLNMSCHIHIAYCLSLYLSDILYYPRLLKFA